MPWRFTEEVMILYGYYRAALAIGGRPYVARGAEWHHWLSAIKEAGLGHADAYDGWEEPLITAWKERSL